MIANITLNNNIVFIILGFHLNKLTMNVSSKILALSARLDYLKQLTENTKIYYAKLLKNNNEVPYVLSQLTQDIGLLDKQVKQYKDNVQKLSNL